MESLRSHWAQSQILLSHQARGLHRQVRLLSYFSPHRDHGSRVTSSTSVSPLVNSATDYLTLSPVSLFPSSSNHPRPLPLAQDLLSSSYVVLFCSVSYSCLLSYSGSIQEIAKHASLRSPLLYIGSRITTIREARIGSSSLPAYCFAQREESQNWRERVFRQANFGP
jgi:hypothetical protein